MQRENPAQGFSLFEKRTRFQKRPRELERVCARTRARVRIFLSENAACAFLRFCVFLREKRPFSDRVFSCIIKFKSKLFSFFDDYFAKIVHT